MTEPLLSPLTVEQGIDLQPFNSLALPARAEYFCSVDSLGQVRQALDFANEHNIAITLLGGGSNLVIASDIHGLVIHIALAGYSAQLVNPQTVDVTFAAGEDWHQMVIMCLNSGWYGMENLALIPGSMGAAPIQNIGAYGTELCDLLQSLDAIEIATGELLTLSCNDCNFGYRTSIFKQAAKDQYIITAVTLRLSTVPLVNVKYPVLRDALSGHKLTPEKVFAAVCDIRRNKLPNPKEIPNVGSFFKNPDVSEQVASQLLTVYPAMPNFPQAKSRIKIPAAWLIESCGFKGCRQGDVGIHSRQALVIVNYGGNGQDILSLASQIQAQVYKKFGITLDIEPRIYGVSI